MTLLMRKATALILALSLLLGPVNFILARDYQVYADPGDTTVQEVSTTIASVHEKHGNSTLAVSGTAVEAAGYKVGDVLKVEVKGQTLLAPLCTNYSDVDTGSLVVVKTADGAVILAINMGNVARTYGLAAGDEVKISLQEAGGYLEEYEIRHLERTNDRNDYASDEIFANYRPVLTSGIKPGVLYRSSSPINNEISRAAYADALISRVEGYYPAADGSMEVGVKTVMNLADTPEQIAEYVAKDDFNSPYYKSLFDNGSVVALAMGVDVAADSFKEKLAEGLRFLIEKNGPYLVHCNEGKDRAGFVIALLSCLMGATHEEVVNDYMTTYENYYHVEKGSPKWNKIADSNIKLTLKTVVAGVEKDAEFESINLAKAAENFIKNEVGLTDAEIARLKICLSDKSGTVQEIEKYGHASSDIKIADILNEGYAFGDTVTVTFDNGWTMDMPFLDGYYVDKGAYLLRAYPGHETIAACINYGRICDVAGLVTGDRFTVAMKEKEGYLFEYEVRKLERTNNREDYASDEVFANFRNIKYGSTGENRLYRSSSPVNNEIGRAVYADRLMGEAGVKTVVNLADTGEQVEGFLADDEFSTPNYAALYSAGKVKTLNLGLAYETAEFKQGIIEGLKFMSENEAPYLFHCTEGKDRTGFFGALLNALMGATKEEIVADYMRSYENFYHISKEENNRQYELISNDVLGMLKHIVGSDELDGVDFQARTIEYLKNGGMTDAEIHRLIRKLVGPVASVGGTSYDSLKEAVEAAQAGDTVKLLNDAYVSAGEELVIDKKLTLDLDKHLIKHLVTDYTKNTYVRLIDIVENGDLTITGNGVIKGVENGADCDSKVVIAVEGNGKLAFLNGRLEATGEGSDGMYGVYVLDGGTAVFGAEGSAEGPVITTHFAAIGTNNTTAPANIRVYGGTYTAKAAPDAGDNWTHFCAAVYAAAGGYFDIEGGTFNGYYGISSPYKNVTQALEISGGEFNATSGTAIFIDEQAGNGKPEDANRVVTATINTLPLLDGYGWVKQSDGTYKASNDVDEVREQAKADLDEVDLVAYSNADLANVLAAIKTAKEELAAADGVKEVKDALAKANATISAQKTNEQKAAEAAAQAEEQAALELANAKAQANDQLDAIDTAPYSGEQLALVEKAITDAKARIAAASSITDVFRAAAEANVAVAACSTDAEISATELDGARKLAKTQLAAIDKSKYSGAELAAVETTIKQAIDEVDKAAAVDAVNAALVKANAAVAAQKTNAQKAAEEAQRREEEAKKVTTVTINVKTVNAAAVDAAVKKAGGSNKYVTKIVLGKNVKTIKSGAFKNYTKVTTIELKTKKLTKKSVKNSLKGSAVNAVKVKVGSAKVNKTYVKKYKAFFTKKNAGRKVSVK